MGGYIALSAGSSPGDGSGTKGQAVGLALIAMLQELYGQSLASIVLAAGTYNDLNPGGGFPANCRRLDISPTSGIVIVTGLLAGAYDGQPLRIRNVGAVDAQLPYANVGSLAANRFTGFGGSKVISANGGICDAIYYSASLPGWNLL